MGYYVTCKHCGETSKTSYACNCVILNVFKHLKKLEGQTIMKIEMFSNILGNILFLKSFNIDNGQNEFLHITIGTGGQYSYDFAAENLIEEEFNRLIQQNKNDDEIVDVCKNLSMNVEDEIIEDNIEDGKL